MKCGTPRRRNHASSSARSSGAPGIAEGYDAGPRSTRLHECTKFSARGVATVERRVLVNVQSIIGNKGSDVATIPQTASLRDAVQALGERRVGALVVSGDGRAIEGIVSERDIVRAASAMGAEALDRSVGSVMSTDVVTCTHGDGVDRLMSLMTERRIRHLPVVDDRGQLAGIVSIGDVVKARLTQLEQENHALAEYITGR